MKPDLTKRPSPNFGVRPAGADIDMLVLHYTGMQSQEEALARLCDPATSVSAHYLVAEDGEIFQLVKDHSRAWHAGVGTWQHSTNINDVSIGIEIVNPGHEFGYRTFPDEQMAAVVNLSHWLVNRYAIPASRVVGHSDVAPMRKNDPGELFNWHQLAAAGVGRALSGDFIDTGLPGGEVSGEALVTGLQKLLIAIGYVITITGVYDAATRAAITAFQRHWRQGHITGLADTGTLAALQQLAAQSGSVVQSATGQQQ